jgi:hypothetical protein
VELLLAVKINQIPVELHEQQLPEYRYMDLMTEKGCDHPFKEANTTESQESYQDLTYPGCE